MGKDIGISNQSTHIHMVHVKRQERQTLWAFLLNEGVCAVKQENTGKHELTKIDNLKVMCVLQSMESRGFAKKTFTWQHRYYTITESGLAYLRGNLGILKENVVPKTHQIKNPEPQALGGREGGREMTRGGRGGFRGSRGGFSDRGGRGRGFSDRGARGGFGDRNNAEGQVPEKEFAKPQNQVGEM